MDVIRNQLNIVTEPSRISTRASGAADKAQWDLVLSLEPYENAARLAVVGAQAAISTDTDVA